MTSTFSNKLTGAFFSSTLLEATFSNKLTGGFFSSTLLETTFSNKLTGALPDDILSSTIISFFISSFFSTTGLSSNKNMLDFLLSLFGCLSNNETGCFLFSTCFSGWFTNKLVDKF